MNSWTPEVLIGLVVMTWLLACTFLCRAWKSARWLAGSTVGAALFFEGSAVVCSVMVPRSVYLIPLWGVMFVVLVTHIAAAFRSRGDDRSGTGTAVETRRLMEQTAACGELVI